MSIVGKTKVAGKGSLSQQAYNILRTNILRGDLPLGTPLSRRKLAAEMRMSLLPVGEALQKLELEGIVESRPRVGTRVRIPTEGDVMGHYILREALETMSARLFAERATEADRKEMLDLAIALDSHYESAVQCRNGEVAELVFTAHRAHAQFHTRLGECGGCPALVDAIDRNQTMVLTWLFNSASQFYRLPPHWHLTLMESLNQGKVALADRAMRKHIRFGFDHVSQRIQALNTLLLDSEKGFRVKV